MRAARAAHERLLVTLRDAAARAAEDLGVEATESDVLTCADLLRCMTATELLAVVNDRLSVEETP